MSHLPISLGAKHVQHNSCDLVITSTSERASNIHTGKPNHMTVHKEK